MENLIYPRGLHEVIDKMIVILQMRKLARKEKGTCPSLQKWDQNSYFLTSALCFSLSTIMLYSWCLKLI